MNVFATLAVFAAAGAAAAAPAPDRTVSAAATHYVGGVDWQEQSVLKGDFSCTGKQQNAILGTSDKEIVVAVFTQGLTRPPEVLRFDSEGRAAAEAKIRLDDSSLTVEEIQTLSGSAPAGYKTSATCKGLRLSDNTSEAAHIYWDHDKRRFDSWSQ